MTDRRQFLFTAASASAALLALKGGFEKLIPSAEAQQKSMPTADGTGKYAELAKTAAECIRTGEACAAHCQKQLAKGNTRFGRCDASVHEMLAMTRALLTLASMESPETPKLAALCAEVCHNCSQACAEHKEHFAMGMHLACKACMDACTDCEKACKKVSA